MCLHKECKTEAESKEKLIFNGIQTDDVIHEIWELYTCPSPECTNTIALPGIGPMMEE